MDACIAGSTTRKALENLGYVVHTPAQLYGSQAAADGRVDEDWLDRLAKTDWVAITKDEHILQRPAELAAYKAANIHMFLLPNNVKRDVLIAILHAQLRGICTRANGRASGVWRVNMSSIYPL